MAVLNCTVTEFQISQEVGTIIPAGIVNLTISSTIGEVLDYSEFFVGNDGANVTDGITNVVFSNNIDGTVNAAVYHEEIVVTEAMIELKYLSHRLRLLL